MIRTSAILLMTAAAVWGNLQSGSATSNGVVIRYETKLEPPTPPINNHGGGTLTENNVIKRHVCNMVTRTYFGYDLTAEAVGDGTYRLRIAPLTDRKSTRLNSSHLVISYAVFCLKKKIRKKKLPISGLTATGT